MTTEMTYIYEVYRQGSFSKAAQKLFLTQPALSIAVRKVEAELKTTLFDRNCTPIALTDAGKIYIEKTELIRQLEKDLVAGINDISLLLAGNLNVGGTSYLNSYVLPPVISEFMHRFPNITFSLSEAASGSLFDLLDNGSIDITFSCTAINPDKFTKSHAFYDTVLLAVPKRFISEDILSLALSREDILNQKYLTSSAIPIDLSLFSDFPFILLNAGNNLYQRSMEFLKTARIKPRVIQQLDQLATAYHLCCQGIGVTFIGSLLVTPYSSPDVMYFRIDSPLALRSFNAVTRTNRYQSLAATEFIRLVSEMYAII